MGKPPSLIQRTKQQFIYMCVQPIFSSLSILISQIFHPAGNFAAHFSHSFGGNLGPRAPAIPLRLRRGPV